MEKENSIEKKIYIYNIYLHTIYLTANGCHQVPMVIMHVHKYEIRI